MRVRVFVSNIRPIFNFLDLLGFTGTFDSYKHMTPKVKVRVWWGLACFFVDCQSQKGFFKSSN